jgi:hypothetical protein
LRKIKTPPSGGVFVGVFRKEKRGQKVGGYVVKKRLKSVA